MKLEGDKRNIHAYVPIGTIVLSVTYHEKGIAKALEELREGTDHCWRGRDRKASST